MNAVVVDTSSWVSYFSGRGKKEKDIELALQEGRVFVPPLVIAELLSGKLNKRQHQVLYDMLIDLPMCEVGFEHWVRVANLRRSLARKGISIAVPDAHIAQCAIDLDCYLISEDGIFKRVMNILKLKLL